MKLILFLSLIFSLQTKALTLDEAMTYALQNSHELKELKLQTESAQWNEIKSFSDYLPKIDLKGRHLIDEKFEELEVPFGGSVFVMPAIQPYSSLGLEASLNVFSGFNTYNELAAAHYEMQAADQRFKFAQEKKRIEIQTLFYKALGSQVLVEVADQNIQTLESHLKDVKARQRSGVSTRYDGLRIEVQLEDAKTEKVAAENSVAITRAQLFEKISQIDDGKILIGHMPDNFSRIDVSQLSLQNAERADRLAMIADKERLNRKATARRSHWLPNVSIFGDYEWYNNINHSVTESDQRFKSAYAFGVSLNWNLFDGGASYASQRLAALDQSIAEQKLARFEENIPVVFEEAKRRYSYNTINYSAKLSSIHKAEEAVRLAQSGLKAGIHTNTEVLDSVVELNRAKASAVKSQIDAVEALGQLELSLGHSL